MLLSCQSGFEGRSYGATVLPVLPLLKEAGFDAFDLSVNYLDEALYLGDDWKQNAEKIREAAKETGLICNQSHAPFPTNDRNAPENDAMLFDRITKAMRFAAAVGAPQMVVHGRQYGFYRTMRAETIEKNIAFYRALMPFAEEYGILILTENIHERDPYNREKPAHAPFSKAEDFNAVIDGVGHPLMGGCIDVGHVAMVGEDLNEMISAVGATRLKGLHIHDNDAIHDMHRIPCTEKIDFHDLTRALKKIGYTGDFTLEILSALTRVPPSADSAALKFAAAVCRPLMEETR